MSLMGWAFRTINAGIFRQRLFRSFLMASTRKRLSTQGEHFNFDISGEFEIFPHPIQQPHPPFYLGAGTEGSIMTGG